MSLPPGFEPRSDLNLEGVNLPPLQKLIILYLAESEPQTMNETKKALSKGYKSVWLAFKSLRKKNLIRNIDVKEYRGREYPRYWLSDLGMIDSILKGAGQALLLERARKLFPEAKIVHCFLETIQHMHIMMKNEVHLVVMKWGKMELIELISVIFSGFVFEYDDTMEQLVSVLKRYPEEYEQAKLYVNRMIIRLSYLIDE